MKIQRPKPTGEYAVGTFTYTVRNAREEVINPGTMRSVPARVYYPVRKDAVSGLSQPRTLSPNVVAGIKKVFHLPISFDRMEKTGENVSECYENAPFIEGEHFPLILFNHGLYSYREENSFLCIELASHGYAVISVTHPLEASCAELDDGTVIFADKKVTVGRYQPFWKAYLELKRFEKMKGTDKELSDRFSELERLYCRRENDRIEEWVKDNEAALGYAK
ncbi:MAG: hypothetical protein J5825_03060, partial [Lachnospiraceae bacterium]|nr:hypothetical protein [Lachnospiraceae bacterium]